MLQEHVRAKPVSPLKKGFKAHAASSKQPQQSTQQQQGKQQPAAAQKRKPHDSAPTGAKSQAAKKVQMNPEADLQQRLNSALSSGTQKTVPVSMKLSGSQPASKAAVPAAVKRATKGSITVKSSAALGSGSCSAQGRTSNAQAAGGEVHLQANLAAMGGSLVANVSENAAAKHVARDGAEIGPAAKSGSGEWVLFSEKHALAGGNAADETAAGEDIQGDGQENAMQPAKAAKEATQAEQSLSKNAANGAAVNPQIGTGLDQKGSKKQSVRAVPITIPAKAAGGAQMDAHQARCHPEKHADGMSSSGDDLERRLNSALPAMPQKPASVQSAQQRNNSRSTAPEPTNVAGRQPAEDDPDRRLNSALGASSAHPANGKATRGSSSTVVAKSGPRSMGAAMKPSGVPKSDNTGANGTAAEKPELPRKGGDAKGEKRHAPIVWDAEVAAKSVETQIEGTRANSLWRKPPPKADIKSSAPVTPAAAVQKEIPMVELGADFLALPD